MKVNRLQLAIFLVAALPTSSFLLSRRSSEEPEKPPISCGAVAKYPNAEPKNFEDQQKTKYVDGKHVKVVFDAGATIEFQCKKGYTTDGSKDGKREFNVECTENGFYKPEKTCIKASKCGKVPRIPHATPTGKADGKKVQMKCDNSHSLDGKKVIAGGFGKNAYFDIECIEFSGVYKEFKGECKPYSFMPTGQVIQVYNKVFEVLFQSECARKLQDKFGADGKIPSKLEAACSEHMGDQSGDCSSLVGELKSDFEKAKKEREDHQKESEKDWFEEDKLPGVSEESKAFCEKLWKLVEMPGGL